MSPHSQLLPPSPPLAVFPDTVASGHSSHPKRASRKFRRRGAAGAEDDGGVLHSGGGHGVDARLSNRGMGWVEP